MIPLARKNKNSKWHGVDPRRASHTACGLRIGPLWQRGNLFELHLEGALVHVVCTEPKEKPDVAA